MQRQDIFRRDSRKGCMGEKRQMSPAEKPQDSNSSILQKRHKEQQQVWKTFTCPPADGSGTRQVACVGHMGPRGATGADPGGQDRPGASGPSLAMAGGPLLTWCAARRRRRAARRRRGRRGGRREAAGRRRAAGRRARPGPAAAAPAAGGGGCTRAPPSPRRATSGAAPAAARPLGAREGSGGRGVPGAAASEQARGQGPEAGAGEPVQLLQDLHLFLVHLRERSRGQHPPATGVRGGEMLSTRVRPETGTARLPQRHGIAVPVATRVWYCAGSQASGTIRGLPSPARRGKNKRHV